MQDPDKTNNRSVNAVYKIVLDHEHVDSDYWNEDHGSADIIQVFENLFTIGDWHDLAADLQHWTTPQLELFTQAIMGGYSGYTNNGVYYQDAATVKEITATIPHRLDLLLAVIDIEKMRALPYRQLSCVIRNNLNFIADHFGILLAAEAGYLPKIQRIYTSLDLQHSGDEQGTRIKEQLAKASL